MTPLPRLKINVNVGRKPGETYRDSQWSLDSLKLRFGANKHEIFSAILLVVAIGLIVVGTERGTRTRDVFAVPKNTPSNFNEISHYEKDGKIYYVISCEKR